MNRMNRDSVFDFLMLSNTMKLDQTVSSHYGQIYTYQMFAPSTGKFYRISFRYVLDAPVIETSISDTLNGTYKECDQGLHAELITWLAWKGIRYYKNVDKL